MSDKVGRIVMATKFCFLIRIFRVPAGGHLSLFCMSLAIFGSALLFHSSAVPLFVFRWMLAMQLSFLASSAHTARRPVAAKGSLV